MKRRIMCIVSLAIAATSGVYAQKVAEASATADKMEACIVEYGEYSTTNNPSNSTPTWTFRKETTQIKIKADAGFGIRFHLPGPYAEDKILVSVTIAGGFGPPGVVGYEFKRGCPVKDNQCVGDMIVPCGGISPPRPGECSITVKYGKSILSKTFTLSN